MSWRPDLETFEPRVVPSTFYLHQGDSVQHAIALANPGDDIILDAGATFRGPITLLSKPNPDQRWITIESNNFNLAPGVRVAPSDSAAMAKIVAPGIFNAAVRTIGAAAFYRLQGLEILPIAPDVLVDTLVTIGNADQTPADGLPHDIVIDQCYIHGLDGEAIKRGIALNGGDTTVSDCYVSGFKLLAYDSQAIAGWNGTGPYTIRNDYLEAAGENVLFGGATSTIQQVPAHIAIVDNLFSKPLSWDPYDPSYAGVPWSVKNLLELKNAEDVWIEGNTFENNWVQSQNGYAILFTPRGAQSGGPWVTVSDVTFVHNSINHVAQGFDILGSDDSSRSQITTNIIIRDNLYGPDIGNSRYGGTNGQFLVIGDGVNGPAQHLAIDHNTIVGGRTIALIDGTVSDFSFTNNIVLQAGYGIVVSGYGQGLAAFSKAFVSGFDISNNVIVGGSASEWPALNWCLNAVADVGFLDFADGDYELLPDSPFHDLGSDGTDLGARLP